MGSSRALFHPSAWKRTLGRKKGNRASAWSTADEATMPRACLPIRNHSSFFGSLCSPQCLPPPAFTPLPPNHPHCQSSQLSLSKDNSWSSGATVVRTSLYQVLLSGAGEGAENSVLASLCFQMLPRVFKQLFFQLWSLEGWLNLLTPPPSCCRSPNFSIFMEKNWPPLSFKLQLLWVSVTHKWED